VPRILVSGFEPFATVLRNPSGDCVASLRAEGFGGNQIVWTVLPVTWSGAGRVLTARADRESVAGCLMFGVSSATRLRVERRAFNLAAARLEDNAGICCLDQPLCVGATASTAPQGLDLEALVSRLRNDGVEVDGSDDPGRYICNALYYAALTAERPWSAYSVFVHVPPTGAEGMPALQGAIRQVVKAYRAALKEALTEGGRGR